MSWGGCGTTTNHKLIIGSIVYGVGRVSLAGFGFSLI